MFNYDILIKSLVFLILFLHLFSCSHDKSSLGKEEIAKNNLKRDTFSFRELVSDLPEIEYPLLIGTNTDTIKTVSNENPVYDFLPGANQIIGRKQVTHNWGIIFCLTETQKTKPSPSVYIVSWNTGKIHDFQIFMEKYDDLKKSSFLYLFSPWAMKYIEIESNRQLSSDDFFGINQNFIEKIDKSEFTISRRVYTTSTYPSISEENGAFWVKN